MAYNTKYRIRYTNEEAKDVIILIQKDQGSGDVQEYAAEAVTISCNSENSKPLDPIIGRELSVTFDMRSTDIDYWEEFVDAVQRDWKAIVTIDEKYVFHGFLMPDEGAVPFQDRPYSATIRFTDGLGLLKQQTLQTVDDVTFEGEYFWIQYLAGALKKTGLDLPIRIYDNVYHDSMFRRDTAIELDLWQQAKLDYRTFEKSAIELTDCYTALKILLEEHYRLEYWNGMWVVQRLGLLQHTPYVGYYTDYDYRGENPVGHELLENHAEVGKNVLIYPINENQIKSANFASKSQRLNYKYNVWAEIPKNNKFEHYTIIYPGFTVTNVEYDIPDWEHGKVSGNVSGQVVLNPTIKRAYRRSTFSLDGIETDREVVIETNAGEQIWLRSEGIPVKQMDKITIGLQFRTDSNHAPVNWNIRVYIVSGGARRGLQEDGTWVSGLGGVTFTFGSGEDTTVYKGINVESDFIPADGILYIALEAQPLLPPLPPFIYESVYYKDFSFSYIPYTSGGYTKVNGDFYHIEQNTGHVDKYENEVHVSDSTRKVFKGAILKENGDLTSYEWYRFGNTENLHYKQIAVLERFNMQYRRYWRVEGDFNSLEYAPNNQQDNKQPIAFHKRYHFTDINGYNKYFMLSCPVRMDLIRGWFTGVFTEVKQDDLPDGQHNGDTSYFKYLF